MSTISAATAVTVTRCDSGTWVVALRGEHDLSTAPLLERETSSIWPRCSGAVIDLSEADFISSSVIRWLMRVARELEAHGAFTLSIVEGEPSSFVARTLGLFGVRDEFACYPTQEEAVAHASAGSEKARQRSPAVPGCPPS